MKVVIVDGDVSYPPTSGKRLRTLNLMVRLADRHEITYLARADREDSETVAAYEYLADHGIRAKFIQDPIPRKKGVSFYCRLAANIASPLPYSVATHQSPRMRAAVNDLAACQDVDLWQCEWSAYLSCLADQPRDLRLCIAHNVDSVIWKRYYEVERHPLRKRYIGLQWKKFEAYENNVFHQAGRVVAVSQADAEWMRTRFHVAEVEVVENGVDCDWFMSDAKCSRSLRYVFLGALDWRPNQDAIRWLLDEITPQIRTRVPNAELLIVGRNPPAWLRQRVRFASGVQLAADVADVRPYLADSQLMIVPLRIGGGSRLKILEALAAGLPVVATSVGAEGLRLTAGKHYWRADTTEAIVDTVSDCLTNSSHKALEMAADGRRFVQQEYDWDYLADQLHEIWMMRTPQTLHRV